MIWIQRWDILGQAMRMEESNPHRDKPIMNGMGIQYFSLYPRAVYRQLFSCLSCSILYVSPRRSAGSERSPAPAGSGWRPLHPDHPPDAVCCRRWCGLSALVQSCIDTHFYAVMRVCGAKQCGFPGRSNGPEYCRFTFAIPRFFSPVQTAFREWAWSRRPSCRFAW